MNRSLPFQFLPCALACAQLFGQARAAQPEIQVVQSLHFGGLLVSPFGGSVTLTEEGALIPDGGGITPMAQPTYTEARLRFSGPPGLAFSLRVEPASPVLLGPGAAIRLTDFRTSLPGLRGVFDATGQAEVRLGGRLDLPSGTAPGLYRAPQVNLWLKATGLPEVVRPFTILALLRAPLLLTATGELDFGCLIPGTQPGTFEVLPGGGHRSLSGSGPRLFRGRPGPATFQLAGPAGAGYSIQLPSAIQLVGAGPALRVEHFTCSAATSGVLPAGGISFAVGAGLVVPAEQVPGLYRGVCQVTVNYQ